jgi:hypothetical protein
MTFPFIFERLWSAGTLACDAIGKIAESDDALPFRLPAMTCDCGPRTPFFATHARG